MPQIIYHQPLAVNPSLPSYYTDDSVFAHLFTIPPQYHTLNLGYDNALEYIQFDNSPGIVGAQTTDLTGTLVLTSSSASLSSTITPQTKVYVAEYYTNTILFEYVEDPFVTKDIISVNDSILSGNVTKIVHTFKTYNYLEFSGALSFTYDQIVSVGGILIKVKAGKGIFTTVGVCGLFSTDHKEISYYAKFSPPIITTRIATTIGNIQSPFVYNDNIYSQFVKNNSIATGVSSNNRFDVIQTNILNPAISNISSLKTVPNVDFGNQTVDIDGTSDNFITVSSWLDIPNKTDYVSYGISNIRPKSGDLAYMTQVDMSIVIDFNWVYTPVPVTNFIGDDNTVLVDGWLVHTFTTPAIGQSIPAITYVLDAQGNVSFVRYTNQIDNNTKSQYVLFAGNGVVYRTNGDTLYQGVQNQATVPCLYSFDVNNLRLVNDIGGNMIPKPHTKSINPISITDVTLYVENTDDFFNSGFLIIQKYTYHSVNNGSSRTYSLDSREIVKYSSKDPTHFYGISRGLFGTTPQDYSKIVSGKSEWFFEISAYYPI